MANTYKVLASLRPTNANEATLYTVPASTSIIATLHICNQSAAARTYDVRLGTTTADYVAFTTTIQPYTTHKINPIAIGAAGVVKVLASVADLISFVLVGMTIT